MARQLKRKHAPFRFVAATKDRNWGHRVVNGAFRRRELFIHPRCEAVCRTLRHWKGGKTGEDGALSHAADALRYGVLSILGRPAVLRWLEVLMSYGLPLTIDISERSRMQESARRRRLLDGVWEVDLVEAMAQYIAPEQMAAWGRPDLTKNVFRSVVSQLAILYDREPIIDHPDPSAAERMRELCRSAGVWTQGPALQRLVIGQREAFRRVSWEDGRLLVRLVPVDCCEAEAHANTPSEPHTVYEYRRRELDGQKLMTRDVLSTEAGGVYRIESADGQRDLTVDFLGQDYSVRPIRTATRPERRSFPTSSRTRAIRVSSSTPTRGGSWSRARSKSRSSGRSGRILCSTVAIPSATE